MKYTFLTIILIGLLTSCGNAQKMDKQNENASATQNADTIGMVTAEKPEEEKPQKYTHSKPTELENHFSEVYLQFPQIPKGLLEAIAYDRTKIQQPSPYREKDTIIHHELFNLVNNISNDLPMYEPTNSIFSEYCKKNKINIIDFLNDEKSQILFIATELMRLKKEKGIVGNKFQDFEYSIDKLFGFYPFADGFKSIEYIQICSYFMSGIETNEIKTLPHRELLKYFNSIRTKGCMEDGTNKSLYDAK